MSIPNIPNIVVEIFSILLEILTSESVDCDTRYLLVNMIVFQLIGCYEEIGGQKQWLNRE